MNKPYYFLGIAFGDKDYLVHYGDENADVEMLFDNFLEARAWIIQNTTGWTYDEITPISINSSKHLTQ